MSMRDRARKTAERTDKELSVQELKLLLDTDLNVEKLAPNLTSYALYKEWSKIVVQATSNNNDVAQLEQKLRTLGDEGWDLTCKIIDALR